MSCIDVGWDTQTILDHLASATGEKRVTEAVAGGVGLDVGVVVGVLAELVDIGWVFGRNDRWQLTGAGYSHVSTQRRSGLLGDGR